MGDKQKTWTPFICTLTAYYPGPYRTPEEALIEGGDLDRHGNPLHTLQDFLEGNSPYVSAAGDPEAFPYGAKVRCIELEEQYGRIIPIRVVDTGSEFTGKGHGRLDICVSDMAASLKENVNKTVLMVGLL